MTPSQDDLVEGVLDDALRVGHLQLGHELAYRPLFDDGVHSHPAVVAQRRNGGPLQRPTISPLSDAEWVAVNTIIEERTVRDLIPRLKAARAQGIVEYPLNKIVL